MSFIYQIIKSELENHIKLTKFSVNDKFETKLEEITVNYQILCKKEDFEALNIKSDKIILAEDDFLTKKGEKVVKIEIKSKELHEYLRSELKENKFEVFEADLPVEHSYLIDNDVKISKKSQYFPLKYLSVDIETTGRTTKEQEIILISSFSNVSKKMSKVYVNLDKLIDKKLVEKVKFEEFEVILCSDEKEMLEKFREEVIEFSPQAIIGWNVIDFDFKVIRERMRVFDLKFTFSKFGKNESKLRIINDFFKDSSMMVEGILVFDIIALLKTNFIIFKDYKLDTVAKEVLGDGKIDVENKESDSDADSFEDKLEAITKLFEVNPSKLIEYNFKDSLLVSQIVEKLKILELMCKRSILTNTPISRVKSPIATLDIMYLEKLHKRGLVANSNFNFSESAPIEGAFVVEPKRGFYNDIFVFDFKSLYPSVIMTFNIDPFTYGDCGEISAPNGAKFEKKDGILPQLIFKLYKERDIAKSKKDDIKSYALKTTMNSFYGAMASPKSRFYNKEVGGAITAFARGIIQKAKAYVESLDYDVIYGDTDSIFVKIKGLDGKSLEDKKKIGAELEKKINDYFNLWVEREFGQKSFLIIENEKMYSNFFIASKKRYVGFDEFTGKLGFVGMEAIRGDWTQVAKDFQIELVKMIFSNSQDSKIKEFILDYVKKLESGEFDDKLVYTKKITKPLAMYVKMTPPHVRAAREVENFKGRVVKYVLLKDGPKHISLIGDNVKYDYKHYIEKQLKGVSDDLLDVLGLDFDDIVNSRSQKSLSRFF